MAEFIIGSPVRQFARRHPRLRRLLWRLDFALVWTIVMLARLLPLDFASRLGSRVGRVIGSMLKSKSQIMRRNFEVAFPEKSDEDITALIGDAWGRAGRILGEYPHLDSVLRDEDRLQIDIRHPLPAYEGGSPPVVIGTAHLSNWEVVCSAMAKLGMANASLYSPLTNPYLDRMLAQSREALNCELVPRDNAARRLVRVLNQGRSAGFVCDRRVQPGSPVEFFGSDKLSTTLPAKLALKVGCPLVPVQVKRIRDARYRVIFHAPITPRNTAASTDEQALDMTRQLHEQFEQWIREEPADWLCTNRLWGKEEGRCDSGEQAQLRAITESTESAGNENDAKSNAA